MNFRVLVFGLGLLVLSSCDAQTNQQIVDDTISAKTESAGVPIEIGRSFTLTSKTMQTEREINIWTPPSYQSDERAYPVLYVIDGGLAQDFHHISGLAQLATINGNTEEMIVVGIKTENRLNELAHTAVDPRYIKPEPRVGKSHIFTQFVQEEVIPYVEENYRTGERRAVIGESLAGLFITDVFLTHPTMFTDYFAISPSLWWDDKNLAESAADLLAKHDDSARHLYLTMGDEGGTMQGGLDLVMAAITANPPKGLVWKYVDRRASETHSSIYHGAAMDALKFSFGLPSPDYGPAPWYLVEGGQPPEEEEK